MKPRPDYDPDFLPLALVGIFALAGWSAALFFFTITIGPAPVSDFGQKIIPPLLGTFVGAGLAFGANYFLQWRTRRSAELDAGNMALLCLIEQWRVFANVRAVCAGLIETEKLRFGESTPSWLYYKPIIGHYGDQRIDFQSLTYLMSVKGRHAIAELHAAQNRHLAVLEVIKEANAGSALMQGEFAKAKIGADGKTVALEDFINAVGPLVTTDQGERVDLLYQLVNQGDGFYRKAYQILHSALAQRFKESSLMSDEDGAWEASAGSSEPHREGVS
jgi:hypothetical protein